MVQTKRQVNRETDRFGGYGDRSGEFESILTDIEPSETTASETAATSDTMLMDMPPITSAQPETETYSARGTATEKTAVPERPAKAPRNISHEDVMPSIKTRAYVNQAPAEDIKAEVVRERRAHINLDARTKVMLIVYVAIALVLAIAVIATGVSISKATAQVESLTAQIAQKQTVIAEQGNQIANVTNEATIRDEAIKNGMVDAGDPAYSVKTVEKIEYPEPTPHTNGFDRFADAFGGFVG